MTGDEAMMTTARPTTAILALTAELDELQRGLTEALARLCAPADVLSAQDAALDEVTSLLAQRREVLFALGLAVARARHLLPPA